MLAVVSKSQLYIPVTVYIVVEGQFLAALDIPLGEDTHPHAFPDNPFGDITIWVARVIGESSDASLLGCIKVLFRDEYCRLSFVNSVRHATSISPPPAAAS
jgi:hypothetical protein